MKHCPTCTCAVERRPLKLKTADRIRKTVAPSVVLSESLSVRDFAESLNVAPFDLVQWLIMNGCFATPNHPIPTDHLEDFCKEFSIEIRSAEVV